MPPKSPKRLRSPSPVDQEFTAYGAYEELVRCMVDDDEPKEAVRYFYESIDHRVKYNPVLDDAMRDLVGLQSGIRPTTLLLKNDIDPESSHAVCLVKCNGNYYFFDPNGIVLPYDSAFPDYYNYWYNQKKLSTGELIHVLEQQYGISFQAFPVKKGVQLFAPENYPTFITGGGFCMFYIYWFIEYISKNFNMKSITKIITYRYTKANFGEFPAPDDVPGKSRLIINTRMNHLILRFVPGGCNLLP